MELASWSHLFWKSRREVNVSRSASVRLEVSQAKTLESLRIASQDDFASYVRGANHSCLCALVK
jgi:hypothetical protein